MTSELPAPLVRIELDGWSDVASGARTTNVYLVRSERPALIGCGHPAQTQQLTAALADHGVKASAVERVVVNSWAADVIGGRAAFPRADVFVTSPDLTQPRHWNGWRDARRATFLAIADEVFERVDAWGRPELDPWVELAFPSVSNNLDFIPLRAGHTVVAGGLELEVVAAPGPNAGHSLLWCEELGVCFGGDVELDGLPMVESPRDYIVSLERAMQLGANLLLPVHGAPGKASWTLKRLVRFCSNYLSNAPSILLEPKTVLDVVDEDLGHIPEHPATYVEAVQRHRPFLEELVRSRVLEADGEGLGRTYVAG